MKILSKIRALFNFKGEVQEMSVSAAEIKKDKIFLHPTDDPEHVFCIKAKSVDILIDPQEELGEDDITVIDTQKGKDEDEELKAPPRHSGGSRTGGKDVYPNVPSYYIPQKRKMTLLFYPDEYDMIMEHIQSYGYKKTEYFLACAKAARPTSLASAYKYYSNLHKQKKAEDLRKAREAQQSTNNAQKVV